MIRYIRETSHRRRYLLTAGILLVAACLLAILELTNVTHFFHNNSSKPGQPTVAVSNRPKTAGSVNKTQQGAAEATNSTDHPKIVSNTSAELKEPFGNFVSAHRNVPADAVLSSVCNTTAGATCQVTFTNGGITKSLPSQQTDLEGSAYWSSWTPQSIGLTSGSWQVKAIASLGDQTKQGSDAMPLEIR